MLIFPILPIHYIIVSTGKQLSTMLRTMLPLSSMSVSQKKKLVIAYISTHRIIPEAFILQQHLCENL